MIVPNRGRKQKARPPNLATVSQTSRPLASSLKSLPGTARRRAWRMANGLSLFVLLSRPRQVPLLERWGAMRGKRQRCVQGITCVVRERQYSVRSTILRLGRQPRWGPGAFSRLPPAARCICSARWAAAHLFVLAGDAATPFAGEMTILVYATMYISLPVSGTPLGRTRCNCLLFTKAVRPGNDGFASWTLPYSVCTEYRYNV